MPVHTLGRLGLSNSSFQRQKPLLLLTYLAMEGEQERRFISELFWPKASHARSSLSVALSQLRKFDDSLIITNKHFIKTELKTDFDLLLEKLAAKKYEQVIENYKGAFLEVLDLEIGVELEEWIYKQREFIALQVQEACLRLAEKEARNSEFKKAAKLANKACKIKGLDVSELRNVKRIYLLLKAANSSNVDNLQEIELDISIEKARAYFTPTHNLPKAKSALIGREPEINEIITRLAKDDCRLISIIGMGGIGKTRLALQIAHEAFKNKNFADGIYFVALEAISNAHNLGNAIAHELNIALDGQSAEKQIISQIANKEVLLVLDNFEQLISARLLLPKLLGKCPKLKILVSSRERLNIADEWALPLKGLPYPKKPIELAKAENFEAIRLFLSRAKRARLDFVIDNDNLAAIIKICHLLAGSPLGLELAATWLKMMPCSEIAAEIETNLNFLDTSQQDIPARQRSARAVFEYSWKLLSAKEKDILKKLSVFRDGFDKVAAFEVVGSSLFQLASLVDKSLLQTKTNRYHRHPLIYQFCEEKLKQSPDLKAQTQMIHANYFLNLLANKENNKIIIATDLENIRLAWQWAIKNQAWQLLTNSVYKLAKEFHQQSKYIEACNLFDSAIRALDSGKKDKKALGYLLTAKALLITYLGHYDDAKATVEQGLAFLNDIKDEEGIYWGLSVLAHGNYRSGNYAAAKNSYEEILKIAKEKNKPKQIINTLSQLATIETNLNNQQKAKQYYNQVIFACKQNDDRHSLVTALLNLGTLELNIGQPQLAKEHYLESLELAKEINQKSSMPILWHNLAMIACLEENYSKAKNLANKALISVQKTAEKSKEAKILASLAWIMICASALPRAERYVINSLRIANDIADTPAKLTALLRLAQLKYKLNIPNEAVSISTIVMEHPASLGWVKLKARALANDIKSGKQYTTAEDLNLDSLIPQILNQSYPKRQIN